MLVCLEAAGAYLDALAQRTASRKSCPLEIRESTTLAGRVEFGRANAIGITAAYLRAFITNGTLFSHNNV